MLEKIQCKILFTREDIEKILPHRGKALLLDEILELEPGFYAKCKFFTKDKEFLTEGHFFHKPIIPGHYLSEMGNLACALILLTLPEHKGKLPLLTESKYNSILPVFPGQKIIIVARIENAEEDPVGVFQIFAGKRLAFCGSVKCILKELKNRGE